MHQPYTQLYLHLVWATWDRLPLVRPEIRQAIYGCIQDQLRKHRCEVIAIGGIADHVHVLTRFPTTETIATGQHALPHAAHGRRETLGVDPVSGRVREVIHLPGNSWWPPTRSSSAIWSAVSWTANERGGVSTGSRSRPSSPAR